MEARGCAVATARKTNLTPKAIIYKKFGNRACYKVEEVQESIQNGCPGLAIPQKGPSLYRCSLELPEIFVVSGTFKKKKDAEQCAAEMALEKLGINPAADNPTEKEPWDALIERMTYLFSDEFLQSLHPLSGHLRAALRRDDDLCGFIPASVVAVCDAKLSNLCKLLNPKAEANPFLAVSFVMTAATRLAGSVVTTKGQLSIQKQHSYSPEIIEALDIINSDNPDTISVEAVYIPSSLDKLVQPVSLTVSSAGYYLDAIAQKLGVADANKVLLSRTIGKASSDTRVYFVAPESSGLSLSENLVNLECQFEGSLNPRASYICSQVIYGDAIMASIGYTWRSKDLFHEDLSMPSYYRMFISKMPSGNYKLSREAILTAELPSVFTTKSNWRGSFPREILCSFCRQHRLSEPVFSSVSLPLKASSSSRPQKPVNVAEPVEQKQAYSNGTGTATDDLESLESRSVFRCKVKITSKCRDLIIECSPKEIYKKQNDSVHNASLKILSWLNGYFKDPGMPVEKLNHSASVLDIQFCPENFFKEFSLCPSVHTLQHEGKQEGTLPEAISVNVPYASLGQNVFSFNIEGSDSGVCPSNGSLLCISYFVSLVSEGKHTKELLESNAEFEFEMGTGAVISPLETVLAQMSVGQSAFFSMDLPPHEFILAAANDHEKIVSSLSSKACCLEYSTTLLSVTEPPEERMEQALFSPPLSKQRVEYALQHIKKSCATTLVDFGCGSGSLLDSLLDYSTSLEKVVGVDISQKSLSRAAKILHTKLSSTNSDSGIKSAVLYGGSIIDFDSRLCGFDIGTCLEVIEHMEEEQACLFGNVALGYFHPKILIVSTPNYEYNVILQRSSLTNQEEDPDEKTESQSCKFRNHDHRFEWTREQFNSWATELARQHNYNVEFSGVGGSADVEPGFASQIAVFTREILPQEDDLSENNKSENNCKVVWEWNRFDTSDPP
ncbi:small RNA 2'-O-methyltransferase isoform X1 [Ricinus communis]|uniref:small RNA 2'-O-methyltransferase isoform X1 n=2 Tax=Ricinus communis TaxID=3988 RepID=UPI00201A66A1|nr:small RNA 2'-O-methyltransferase isoform X1 [Ricinus communis]XP_048229209.1 small RNA 2'-O-methyltransferase isoform X1 [Ricinus communis]XP_048229210.1 small RNA 2'-O-methyltransferase isoform X1 [Ricinus communis]